MSEKSDSVGLNRRQLLKQMSIAGVTAVGASGIVGASSTEEDYDIHDATGREISALASSEPYHETVRDLSGHGRAFPLGHAKAVRRQANNEAFKLAVPVRPNGSFDPVSGQRGIHAYINGDEVQLIALYEEDGETKTYVAGSENQDDGNQAGAKQVGVSQVRASASCRFGWLPGYHCMGVYDTEEACTVIGGINAFIFLNDPTGIGVIDDILAPVTASAGAACGLEQAAELVIADWLGACSSNNWVWEVYEADWWNPSPYQLIVAPKCG